MDNMENKEIEIGEKYLPIGTVVMLQGGKKRVMITGFCTVANDKQDKLFDYSGCLYPEGVIESNLVCLFDHSQIEKIYHLGLQDEEEKDFKQKLTTAISTIGEDNLLKVNSEMMQAKNNAQATTGASEAPVAPTTPAAPVAPVSTEAPVMPTAPVSSEAPAMPAASEAPAMPVASEAPAMPAASEAPVMPTATE